MRPQDLNSCGVTQTLWLGSGDDEAAASKAVLGERFLVDVADAAQLPE